MEMEQYLNESLLAEYPAVSAMLSQEHIERLRQLSPQSLWEKLEEYSGWIELGGKLEWRMTNDG